jgi:hypothetical protein
LDTADIFENISDVAQKQLIVNETNKSLEICEPSTGYILCVLIYAGHGMELTHQYVNADTDKTSAVIIKLAEHLLDHGQTLWMDNLFMTVRSWPDS